MVKIPLIIAFFLMSGSASPLHGESVSPGDPEYTQGSAGPFKAAASYEEALRCWKSPEDVQGWVTAHFTYDRSRAARLSETQRIQEGSLSIYSPSELFDRKAGICVDLARFAVETLRRIDPGSDAKYLRIEFEPIQIKGDTFRFHWLVRFKREGRLYFFADSNRPVHVAGPYHDLRDFIDAYERTRGRKIVAFRELDSYQKQRRTQGKQRRPSEKP